MIRRFGCAAGVVALLMSGGAAGQDPAGSAGGLQGVASRRRAPPNVFISPSGEPFRAADDAAYAVATWFAGADNDHDHRVTREEFLADADRFFRKLDADGDGVIDGFEIRAYEDEIAPEILPRIGRLRAEEGQNGDLFNDRNGGVGRRGAHGERNSAEAGDRTGRSSRITASDVNFSGAGAYGVLNEPEPVQACDTDLDGRVSRAEWRTKAARRFLLLDTKRMGALTLDALPKSYVQTAREKEAARRAKQGR